MATQRSFRSKVGVAWATLINTWGQLSVIAGVFNTLVLISVLYSTWLKDIIPFWAYSLMVVVCIIAVIVFIIKIGLAGYYEFFNKWSALDRIEKKIDQIEKKIGTVNKSN